MSDDTENRDQPDGGGVERPGSPPGLPRLEELGEKITRATKVIAELRESNYELNGEVVSLRRQLEEADSSLSEERSRADSTSDTDTDSEAETDAESEEEDEEVGGGGDDDGLDEALTAKLDVLSAERQEIRSKVEALLERIEEIESRL